MLRDVQQLGHYFELFSHPLQHRSYHFNQLVAQSGTALVIDYSNFRKVEERPKIKPRHQNDRGGMAFLATLCTRLYRLLGMGQYIFLGRE